jgi:hypothetical protein
MSNLVEEVVRVLDCPPRMAALAVSLVGQLKAGREVVVLWMDPEARGAFDAMRRAFSVPDDEWVMAQALALLETVVKQREFGFTVLRVHDPTTKDWREIEIGRGDS